MVYKLLSFILIYILSVINFAIILLPLMLFIIPFFIIKNNIIDFESLIGIILFVLFLVSCLMNFIILLDFLFGISSRKFLKNTTPYQKIEDYKMLETIFNETKIKFNKQNVELLISNSEDINAFAFGNIKKQYIVLTKGLISKYLIKLGFTDNFLFSIKCIMGHEMSHLINKDYLPTLLLEINEYSSKFISKIIYQFFKIFLTIVRLIPIIGRIISYNIYGIYKILNYLILFFYKYIILSIYKLIYLKISRSKEYRCDMQSSLANGGINMAAALSVLDDNGYITLFSSHPKTQKRIKYVQDVKQVTYTIRPIRGNNFINFVAFLIIILLPIVMYYLINFEHMQENYEHIILMIKNQINILKFEITNFISKMHMWRY